MPVTAALTQITEIMIDMFSHKYVADTKIYDSFSELEAWKERNVFSSGSQSTVLGSGGHPALRAPAVSRPVTQVIETGKDGSQFLYRITWPRTGLAKATTSTQPLYE
ncbi:hypothetical protein ACJJTC_016364 [Scirpophaga incertulas]